MGWAGDKQLFIHNILLISVVIFTRARENVHNIELEFRQKSF
jgi:hypothetical protein